MRKQNEKGITLIALIITIIVMLILVAVTVNVAINGGLFKEASDATTDTERDSIYEQIQGALKFTDKGYIDTTATVNAVRSMFGAENVTYEGNKLSITGKKGTYEYTLTKKKLERGNSGGTGGNTPAGINGKLALEQLENSSYAESGEAAIKISLNLTDAEKANLIKMLILMDSDCVLESEEEVRQYLEEDPSKPVIARNQLLDSNGNLTEGAMSCLIATSIEWFNDTYNTDLTGIETYEELLQATKDEYIRQMTEVYNYYSEEELSQLDWSSEAFCLIIAAGIEQEFYEWMDEEFIEIVWRQDGSESELFSEESGDFRSIYDDTRVVEPEHGYRNMFCDDDENVVMLVKESGTYTLRMHNDDLGIDFQGTITVEI